MAIFEIQDDRIDARPHDGLDVAPAATGHVTADWVLLLRREIDSYYAAMKQYPSSDISEVLLSLSAISARASEVRGQLQRRNDRRSDALRTKEIDPLLEECDRQFKLHSRNQSVREMEFKLSGGHV